jgi:hypothetical protein
MGRLPGVDLPASIVRKNAAMNLALGVLRPRVAPRWALVAVALLVSTAGCRRTEESTERYAEVLGGAAPVRSPRLDAGILQDQTAYQPASYGPSPDWTSPTEGGATDGGGVEESALRKVKRDELEAYLRLDVKHILDGYDPEQIAALREREADLVAAAAKARELVSLVEGKFDPQEFAQLQGAYGKLLETLPGAIAAGLQVHVLSPSSATVTVDISRLQAAIAPALYDLQSVFAATGLAALEPAAAGPQPAQPMRKVHGMWKNSLSRPLNAADMQVISEMLTLANETLDDLTARIEAAPELRLESLNELAGVPAMAAYAKFAVLQAQLAALFEEAPGQGPQPAAPPEPPPARRRSAREAADDEPGDESGEPTVSP